MISRKRGLEACIFDANSYPVLSGTVLFQLARHWPMFFENHKISPMLVLGRPDGMRRGAGGDFEGVRDLQI